MMKLMTWSLVFFAGSILVGQSVMDLFATLLFAVVVVDIFKRVQRNEPWQSLVPITGFETVFLLWMSVVALSYVASPLAFGPEVLSRFFEFKWILQLYVVIYALNRAPPGERFMNGFLLFVLVCSLYAISIWFLGRNPLHPTDNMSPWAGGLRTGGLLGGAMTFAHVYSVFFCLGLGILLAKFKERDQGFWLLFLVLGLTGVALILSFTRGVWLAMGVATIATAYLYRVRIGLMVSILGTVLLGVAILIWPKLGERLTLAFHSGDEREWIWGAHWRIFSEHPWLGVGYGRNYHLVPEMYKLMGAPEGTLVSHAHNQYLHWLAGAGILGLFCYLLFMGLFLWLTIKLYKKLSQDHFFENRNSTKSCLRSADFEKSKLEKSYYANSNFAKGVVLGSFGAQISFWMGGFTEANFEPSKMKYVMMLVWGPVLWMTTQEGLLPGRLSKIFNTSFEAVFKETSNKTSKNSNLIKSKVRTP